MSVDTEREVAQFHPDPHPTSASLFYQPAPVIVTPNTCLCRRTLQLFIFSKVVRRGGSVHCVLSQSVLYNFKSHSLFVHRPDKWFLQQHLQIKNVAFTWAPCIQDQSRSQEPRGTDAAGLGLT